MKFQKIQILLKHQFQWEKNYFFFAILFTLVIKIIFLNFNVHSFIVPFALAATFLSALFFIKPEFSGRPKGFSDKYILSFPLSRNELLISSVCVNVFAFIPMVLWVFCFHDYAQSFIHIFKSNNIATFTLFCMSILSGSAVLTKLLMKARDAQSNFSFKERAFIVFKSYVIFIFLMILGFSLSLYLENKFDWAVGGWFFELFKKIPQIVESPLLGIGVLFFALYIYLQSQLINKFDFKSFPRPWNLKRDLLKLGGLGFASVMCLIYSLTIIPPLFRGEMHTAVYDRDYKKIETLVKSGIDVNEPNKYGMTPMMVAIENGDLRLIKFLESKGANYNGEIKKSGDKYDGYDARTFAVYSGKLKIVEFMKDKVHSFNKPNSKNSFYPIHVAARFCNAQVMDYLIASGVNIEAKTIKGNTPIVIAAKNNCFESVISLKEAGARFDVIESNGKLALQNLGQNASPELKVYVQKNIRAPASE